MSGFGNPTPHYLSPNIGNYRVGRGFLSAQIAGDVSALDMGNCTEFTFEAKPTTLPHFNTREGVQTKDFVAVTRLEATLTMSLEEITARNLGFGLLGTPSASGEVTIDIFDTPLFYAAVTFTDTSSVGPQWDFTFPLVLFTPQKATSLIAQGSGTWQTIDLTVDVLKDPVTGKFGWATASDFS